MVDCYHGFPFEEWGGMLCCVRLVECLGECLGWVDVIVVVVGESGVVVGQVCLVELSDPQ